MPVNFQSLANLFVGGGRSTGTRRGRVFALSLLGWEFFRAGNVPPVTLSLIGFQVAIFLKLFTYFQNVRLKHVCVSVYHVWDKGDYSRVLLGALVHADEWHLYYNMASLLWKGKTLEKRLGSPYYAYLITMLTIFTGAAYVLVNYVLAEVFEDDAHLLNCAVGFSGVLFAMKVITTFVEPPSTTLLLGFLPISSKWACWAELGLIQILVPHASFTGHLAGILVGFAYTRGPLKRILDIPFLSLFGYVPVVHGFESSYSARFSSSSGPSGSWRQPPSFQAPSSNYSRPYSPTAPSDSSFQRSNSPFGDTGGYESEGSTPSSSLNLEELRRRRAERFS